MASLSYYTMSHNNVTATVILPEFPYSYIQRSAVDKMTPIQHLTEKRLRKKKKIQPIIKADTNVQPIIKADTPVSC